MHFLGVIYPFAVIKPGLDWKDPIDGHESKARRAFEVSEHLV